MSEEQQPQVPAVTPLTEMPTEMPLSKMRCPYSVALQFMVQGYRVARAAWEGSGEYIWLMPPAVVPVEKLHDPILKRIAEENGGTVECKAALRLRTELGRVETGWRPGMDDLMATDWLVVLDEEVMVPVTLAPS